MQLDMLYATYEDGLFFLLENLPIQHPLTKIIIIHQTINPEKYSCILEEIKKRFDILYFQSNNKGVTKSRNLALSKSDGDIVLFCDDDVIYKEGFQDKIIDFHKKQDSFGFITFAYSESEDYEMLDRFSQKLENHTLITILRVGTIQVSCKNKYIKKFNFEFPEDMGAGNKYFLCDEPVFLSNFIKNKIQGIYIPYIIGYHPKESSGNTFNDRNAFISRLLCFVRIFGNFTGRFLYLIYLIKNIKKYDSIRNILMSLAILFFNTKN